MLNNINTMTNQEENWELMTMLNIPWHEASRLKGEDRDFLMDKVAQIKQHIEAQQKAQKEQAAAQGQIVTPENMFSP